MEQLAVGERVLVKLKVKVGEVLLMYAPLTGETNWIDGAVVSIVKFLVVLVPVLLARSVQLTDQFCRPWPRPETVKFVLVLLATLELVWLSTPSM
jgi:hypothetical protein